MLAEDTLLSKDTIKTQPPSTIATVRPPSHPVITWERLPTDFILPDDPVDNVYQPAIAASLTEILLLAGLLSETAQTCTDYGLIATVDGKTIAKAPDWAFLNNITVPLNDIDRSYTPHLDGDVPVIVLEFLSHTDGTEYSVKPENPMGKWYFYEQVLKVPYYGIFDPISGDFQVYLLSESGRYNRLPIEESGRYWIAPMNLSIAAWKGTRNYRTTYWLRFWDVDGNLLPWATENAEAAQQQAETAQQQAETAQQQQVEAAQQQVEAERQKAEAAQQQAEAAQQQAEAERQRADRLAQRLRDLGLDPEA